MNNLEKIQRWSTSPAGFVAGIFLLSRCWVAIFVYLGHAAHPFLEPIPGGFSGVANWWLNPWTTFDSRFYLQMASVGYEPATSVFFPLYPFLLKLAGPNMLAMTGWGVLLSNGALAAGLFYLYHLTRLDRDEQSARLVVIIVAFFPATAYFSAVYTESVFLLWIVATFWCVRTQRWGWVCVWAALAALTRNSGVLVSVMLAVEFWQARRRQETVPPVAVFSAGVPLLAFLAVQGYLGWRFGGTLAGVQGQALFDRHLTWPWTPVLLDIQHLLETGQIHLGPLLDTSVVLLAFILVWRQWRRWPVSYSIFMVGINLMNLCYSSVYWPFTESATRYAMTTFPFSQMLAHEARSLWRRRLARGLLIVIYLTVCAVMCYFFGRKSFNG